MLGIFLTSSAGFLRASKAHLPCPRQRKKESYPAPRQRKKESYPAPGSAKRNLTLPPAAQKILALLEQGFLDKVPGLRYPERQF